MSEAQQDKIAGGDSYIIGRHGAHNSEKVGEIHTILRYRPNPDGHAGSMMTEALLEWIGRGNGNGKDAVKQWLENGDTVHTNFATYKLEVRP